jgi:hypothetical protein
MSPRQAAGRDPGTTMKGRELVVSADEVLELIAYLLASAELCMSEPYNYGSFRLLDGASRLAGYAISSDGARDSAWLRELRGEIDEHKGLLMWDRQAYVAYLHDVMGKVADRIKRETPA